MSTNPYEPPDATFEGNASTPECQRRLDVALIVFAFAFAAGLSFASLRFPSLGAILRPRFGSNLDLLLFPVVHLGVYLWRPAPKLLLAGALMSAFVAMIGGLGIWWSGTVDVVTNFHVDRLHSAYYFSVLPPLAVSIYLATIGWLLRHHAPFGVRDVETPG